MTRQLTEEDIDALFASIGSLKSPPCEQPKATPFDFLRPDRIAKSQLRSIHLMHDNFVRNLVSSLSAYLRTYLTVNLVSVEQLSYAEFVECLPSPTCLASLGLKPYEGNAILELNPSLIFPILEILLGGDGKTATSISREITEIEQNLLDGLLRIILRDLKEAWKAVSPIDFAIEAREKEPQFLQILAPNEAVVAISVEIRIGDAVGMMNLAIPCINIKMMRHKFDQQWSTRKMDLSQAELQRINRLVQASKVKLDARLEGMNFTVETMLQLAEGDVVLFDYPLHRPLDLLVNRKLKYRGKLGAEGRKRACQIEEPTSRDV